MLTSFPQTIRSAIKVSAKRGEPHLGLSLGALAVYAVVALLFPNVRAAAGVYVGVAWLLLCWYWLARTRTLTLGGLTLLYGLCVPWSLGIGLISLHLSALMPDEWPLHGAGTIGPAIGIAALTEEAFKLLPVAVLVALAPGRVRRFAAVDWLLVGLASGAAFMTSEEVQRRLGVLRPGSRGLLDFCGGGSVDRRIDCYGLARFGLNPFGTKQAVSGLFGVEAEGAQYAGHHVLTALVTVCVGLGVVVWRSAPALGVASARLRRRVLAVAIPLVSLWVAVADHVVLNAEAQTTGLGGSGGRWLEQGSTVPAVFRLWWYVGGHGHGRTALLIALLVAALLCDATRARRRDYWSIATPPGPVWADRASGWWRARVSGTGASGVALRARDAGAVVGLAAISLAYVVARDLRVTLSTHARQPGESRRDAMLRGRAALVMQRETREIAADVDAGPGGRHRYRLVALACLALLLVLGLVAGPALARSIGWDTTFSGRWLAGLAENLGKWWNTLSPLEQLALMALAGMVLAVPFGFAWGLFLAGGLAYLAGHGQGVGALLRNPRQATRDYLTNRSLGGMALDAGEFALTFVPAGMGAGHTAMLVGERGVVREYLDDPAAWRAARKALWQDAKKNSERGNITYGWPDGWPRINGKRPRGYTHSGAVWRGEASAEGKGGWSETLKERYPDGIYYNAQGFPDFAPYATHTVKIKAGFTGTRRIDDRLANDLAGLTKKPRGFTWHHVEDGHTMMLVPKDLHDAVPHTGGHAIGKPGT